MITRRMLIGGGLAAGGLAIAFPRKSLRAQESFWGNVVKDYPAVRPASFDRPLPILPVLQPVKREADADLYELAVQTGTAQPLKGRATPILGYDGRWPGPTIVVQRGRPARVRVKNQLSETAAIHNHGHHVSAKSDGHPLDAIRPGGSRDYDYPNDQSGGTYWYHDHALGLTGPHVYRGLAGFYIIRDPAEDSLGLPAGEYDIPLLIQDRIFDANNQLEYKLDAGTLFNGVIGTTLCTNGVHTPHLEVAARRYRLRLLNGSNSRNLVLALSNGDPLTLIGSDGSLLEAPVIAPLVAISPSERFDCVIDFGRYPVGTSIVLKNKDATWPELPDVLRFDVKRRETDNSRVPDKLVAIPRLAERDAKKRRRIRFQLADGMWTMNGLGYDPARIDFRPKLGTTEIWEIHNAEQTQMHPFHQHLVPFQVLDINGAPPPPELRGWKDSVAVPPGGKVRIIMHFTGFTGVYVFHCHKLEHEDHSMMLQQEVIA